MKTIVNVLGTGRCGSSMLDAMIGNGLRAFSCGEVHAWFRPWRKHHFKLDCSCRNEGCEKWKVLSRLKAAGFHKKAFEILDIDFLVDSSKSLVWLIDQQSWIPNSIRVFNIAIYKDPIALAYSNWKRDLPNHLAWGHYKKYYSRLLEIKLPFTTVSYGDLVAAPAKVLSSICNLIGMQYYRGQEEFWRSDLHLLYGSKGVRDQIRSGDSIIRGQEKYPDQFLDTTDSIFREISDDDAMNGIWKVIEERNLMNRRYEKGETLNRITPQKPIWYYKKRVKEMIGRYFPRNYVP